MPSMATFQKVVNSFIQKKFCVKCLQNDFRKLKKTTFWKVILLRNIFETWKNKYIFINNHYSVTNLVQFLLLTLF